MEIYFDQIIETTSLCERFLHKTEERNEESIE